LGGGFFHEEEVPIYVDEEEEVPIYTDLTDEGALMAIAAARSRVWDLEGKSPCINAGQLVFPAPVC
jgi:hypothetical protein